MRGHGIGGTAEVGYRGETGGITIEPIVWIADTNTCLDDVAVLGSLFDLQGADNVRGKAGLRLGKTVEHEGGRPLTLYVGGNAVKVLSGNDPSPFYRRMPPRRDLIPRHQKRPWVLSRFSGCSLL